MLGAPVFGGAVFSFVSPTGSHTSSDSSHSRTTLPVSSLFPQPAFNVTITPKSIAVTSSTYNAVSNALSPPSMTASASVATLVSSSMSFAAPTASSVEQPHAAPVVPSTTQSTLLTLTPVTTYQSTQTSSTSVMSTASADTRATSRRRKAKPHSRGTQPKRAVC